MSDPCDRSCKWMSQSLVSLSPVTARVTCLHLTTVTCPTCPAPQQHILRSHDTTKMWLQREKYFLTLLIVILPIVSSSTMRRKKMLVRRKVLVNNSGDDKNLTTEERQIVRPIKILKRKIISTASPVLSSPLITPETTTISSLPQHKPFTVNETVAAKPDAVKRCENCLMNAC